MRGQVREQSTSKKNARAGTFQMSVVLYDLVDKDGRRYSPYGWRIRMALLHKRLGYDVELCYHGDPKLGFTGQHLVPVLVDGDEVICDSWNIARHLDAAYPEHPLLLNDAPTRSFATFLNKWTDTIVGRPLVRSMYLDIWRSLHPDADATGYRSKREQRAGTTLEALRAGRERDFAAVNDAFAPLAALLSGQPFIAGTQPAYADYIVFGTLQMPRILIGADPLSPEQTAIREWRERIEAWHGALAGAPAAEGGVHGPH